MNLSSPHTRGDRIIHLANNPSPEFAVQSLLQCAPISAPSKAIVRIAYLDIETSYVGKLRGQHLFNDYQNHYISVLGLRIIQGNSDSFIQLVGSHVSKASLFKALSGSELIVTYNGRSLPDRVKGHIGFDFPVIASQLGVVLDKEFPHLDLCPVCWEHGLWGGQKAVERALGLMRRLPGKDGAWAEITWKNYQATGDEKFLKVLCEYNREDIFMLRRIEEILKIHPPTPTPAAEPPSANP